MKKSDISSSETEMSNVIFHLDREICDLVDCIMNGRELTINLETWPSKKRVQIFFEEIISYHVVPRLYVIKTESSYCSDGLICKIENSNYFKWLCDAGMDGFMSPAALGRIKHYKIEEDDFFIDVLSWDSPDVKVEENVTRRVPR